MTAPAPLGTCAGWVATGVVAWCTHSPLFPAGVAKEPAASETGWRGAFVFSLLLDPFEIHG